MTLACLARLTQVQTQEPQWWPWHGVTWLGLALLWSGRSRWGWAALAISFLVPLLFLRDWMSQSSFLLGIAVVGMVEPGSPRSTRAPAPLRAARWLLAWLYFAAGFHKLNVTFLMEPQSCAVHGLRRLHEVLGDLPIPDALPIPAMAATVIGIEFLLAWWILRGHAARALLLGAAFHWPLTLALDPAFAFVTAPGYVALLDAAGRRSVVAIARRHAPWLAAGACVGALVVLVGMTVTPRWHTPFRLGALAGLVVLATLLLFRPLHWRRKTAPHRGPRSLVVGAVVLAWMGSTALPYTGWRVQHAGAMLSSLRVDAPCANHLLLGRWPPRPDPYVRFSVLWIGRPDGESPGRNLAFEERMRSGLHGDDIFLVMHRSWCPTLRERGPLVVEATLRGEVLQWEDFCALSRSEIPWPRGTLGGRAWFPDHLRFQLRLEQRCDQRCVH